MGNECYLQHQYLNKFGTLNNSMKIIQPNCKQQQINSEYGVNNY